MPTQFCTIHKNVETLRICGRCERPFCPDCLINTPVGGRCRECARGPRIPRLRIELWRWPLIALTAAIGGVAAGVVFGMVNWFMFLVAWFAGQFIGGILLPVAGRRSCTALAVVAVVFMIIGVIASGAVDGAMGSMRNAAEYGPLAAATKDGIVAVVFSPWKWIGTAIMSYSAFGRLR